MVEFVVKVREGVGVALDFVVAILNLHVAPVSHNRRLMLQGICWHFFPSSFGFFLGGCPSYGEARPNCTHVELFARVNVGGDNRQLLGSVLENALTEPVDKHLG